MALIDYFYFMFYFINTPKWLKALYPQRLWEMDINKKEIYLTFDDGPHPSVTNFVLDELKKYNACATFFCIGNNVLKHPVVFQRIISDGHTVGNHTQQHLNGFKTSAKIYVEDILEASKYIESNFFRPPYGRIKAFQAKTITTLKMPFKIVMWSLLSADFDTTITPEKCFENVALNVTNGSVVVFHDSEKAAERMMYALPKVLKMFTEQGYTFKSLSNILFD